MNIGKWFKNLSLRNKFILVYLCLAVFSVSSVTAYNYTQTKKILLEESYQDMYQNIEQTEKSINSNFENYAAIMDLIYTNQMINHYLIADYTNISYWEMFQYIDQLLNGFFLINPTIKEISFYSDNKTLPEDNYYFYPIQKLKKEWITDAQNRKGKYAVSRIKKEENTYLCLNRLMNYYFIGTKESILELKIDSSNIREQILQSAKTTDMYLITPQGEILVSSVDDLSYDNIQFVIKDWMDIPDSKEGKFQDINGVPSLCMSRTTSMGTKLILITDQSRLFEKAGNVSKRILVIFFSSSILMFLFIWMYSEWMTHRVEKVVFASKKLGSGEFDYYLEDMGEDEIGLIAKAINTLNNRLQILIKENFEKKLLIKTSEMNLLQEQINPHFLYNALSVISSLALREKGIQTVRSIRHLADFYRGSLSKGKQIISVQEEVILLQNYMKIQEIRFGDSVEITYDVTRKVLPFRTIKLILQPLVENCINHGRTEEETLHIKVKVEEKNNKVVYTVEDDGIGIEPDKLITLRSELKQLQEGYGLKNVDIRVKLHYGDTFGVIVNSVYQQGTVIMVEIPICTQ